MQTEYRKINEGRTVVIRVGHCQVCGCPVSMVQEPDSLFYYCHCGTRRESVKSWGKEWREGVRG